MATQRPLRADARRNYDRLLSAARDAFAELGNDATLDDIAKRAVVGPGTLYRHFPNREALLAAVYRSDVEDLAAQAEKLGRTLPPREALAAWMRLQLEYYTRKRGLGQALKAMLGADSETLTYCRGAMRGAMAGLLESAQRAGVARTDIEPADLMRLVHAVGLATESAPEQAELTLAIVLDGLRPQSP